MGEYPKDIALFPDGKHIAVVNHESNSITTFTIDYGVLVMKGRPMKVETPNCILITLHGLLDKELEMIKRLLQRPIESVVSRQI